MPRRAGQRRAAAFAAALALLLAQAIGLAHALAHPEAPQAALRALLASGPHAQHDHEAQPHHDHADAFDAQHDEGSFECQLLDQLAHADALSAPAPAVAFAAPAQAHGVGVAVPRHAGCACGYHARGPPGRLA